MKRTFAALAALGLALPATAAVSVFGSGDAVACYDAAEGRIGYVSGAKACRDALEQLALSRDKRAATFINYGIVLMHLDRHAEAFRQYEAALRIDDGLGEAWVNRGIARWHIDRSAEAALADLDRGIGLGTADLHVAHYVRGIVHEHLGDVTAAYQDYRRASELAPDWDLPAAELARFDVR